MGRDKSNHDSAASLGCQFSLFEMIFRAAIWSALAFILNLIWEIAHVGLYTLWAEEHLMTIVRALVHCTFGDVAIALTAYVLTGLMLRLSDWPQTRPVIGAVIVVIISMAYTAWSEWYNVYQLGSWTYSKSMPLLFGIGLSPLLQWLILPPLLTLAYWLTCRRLLDRNGTSNTIPLKNFSRFQK